MACSLPPRFDPDAPPAVDEARGIKKAFDRAYVSRGTTSVGRAITPNQVPEMLAKMYRIIDGEPWDSLDFPGGDVRSVAQDIRTYYEEAALELVDGPPPGGRQVEAWFFEQTEAGAVVMAARQRMKAEKAPFAMWFYMVPGHRGLTER